MNHISINTKSRVLYQAFSKMKAQGILNTLQDAEKMLSAFGVNINLKNTIEFDFMWGDRYIEECLYEYIIPQIKGASTTFYVDKNLGFQCGSKLPPQYKNLISRLHISKASMTLHSSQKMDNLC